MNTAPARHASPAAILGWVLTVPGFVMIASLLIVLSGLPHAMGCRLSVLTNATGCEASAPFMHFVVATLQWSLVFTLKGVGLAFLAWSLIYPPVRWRQRQRTR